MMRIDVRNVFDNDGIQENQNINVTYFNDYNYFYFSYPTLE